MERDQAIARIQEDLGANPELGRICLEIVRYLAETPAERLQRVTFGSLSTAAGLENVQDVVLAVQYLSGARLRLLEPQFTFILGDHEFDIPNEDVAEARRTNVFYHPELGEPVPDFEDTLYMYFAVSPEGVELSGARRK